MPSLAAPAAESPWSLVEALLAEQQSMTAVERFAQSHESSDVPLQARHYRDLIPLGLPRPGEQWAFEVDLDACSGCKACVAACHSLNGLEEDELWRSVGLLHGGADETPVIQHITTSCHHCLEPACLHGCPVLAYEKDPLTGIVRHLDDQCIGCQYCILKCPYDAPRYVTSKGIVRKCDMCHDRLASGEAPACVQGCPNRAIRIHVVSHEAILQESEASPFLPGAFDPSYTVPTTRYATAQPLPRNLLPADYYSAKASHSHLPLVAMLVLTQMSVGAFVAEQTLFSYFSLFDDRIAAPIRSIHLLAALCLGLVGMAASVLHLGRPLYAFRAVLGLRRSWLSREILAFGGFAASAAMYVGVACTGLLDSAPRIEAALGGCAAAMGLVAVLCSVMIYVDTRRAVWSAGPTAAKFFLTGVLLGLPAALLVSLAAAAATELTASQVMSEFGSRLCLLVMIAAAVKLSVEGLVFAHLRDKRHTPHKRAALLMCGPLGIATLLRFFFGALGGILLPLVLVSEPTLAPGRGYHPLFIGIATALTLGLLTMGELLERYLFFTASSAPKMPGAPAS